MPAVQTVPSYCLCCTILPACRTRCRNRWKSVFFFLNWKIIQHKRWGQSVLNTNIQSWIHRWKVLERLCLSGFRTETMSWELENKISIKIRYAEILKVRNCNVVLSWHMLIHDVIIHTRKCNTDTWSDRIVWERSEGVRSASLESWKMLRAHKLT